MSLTRFSSVFSSDLLVGTVGVGIAAGREGAAFTDMDTVAGLRVCIGQVKVADAVDVEVVRAGIAVGGRRAAAQVNLVLTVAAVEEVHAGTAVEDVVAFAAIQDVCAAAAQEEIGNPATIEGVVAGVALQIVPAAVADQGVGTAATVEMAVTGAAADGIRGIGAEGVLVLGVVSAAIWRSAYFSISAMVGPAMITSLPLESESGQQTAGYRSNRWWFQTGGKSNG